MLVYLICYIVSFILAWQHIYVLSGLVLLGAALWLYIKDYMRTGNLIHLRGLFCLFFVGGQGISCFKLSRLQTDWALMTWISLFLAVVFSGRSLRYSPVFLTAGRKGHAVSLPLFFLRGIAFAGKAHPDFHERHHCSIPSGLFI